MKPEREPWKEEEFFSNPTLEIRDLLMPISLNKQTFTSHVFTFILILTSNKEDFAKFETKRELRQKGIFDDILKKGSG